MFRLHLTITACIAMLGMLTGCGGNDAGHSASNKQAIIVWAAASTTDAIQAVADQFTHDTGTPVKINPGPSNQLALQIMQGAPADVYLSANRKWADAVEKAGFSAQMHDLLGNQLVLIVPTESTVSINAPADLLHTDVHRVALAGENVPAGIYARQALTKLQLLAPIQKSDKIVLGHDVRSTLAYVERGEVDAGIVYATDAAISPKVRVAVALSDNSHDPIVYSLVLIHRPGIHQDARKFYEYVQSASAGDIFKTYGFVMLSPVSN